MQNENEQQQEELSDIEIAELANLELKKRDEEINKLKKELARNKLYSTVNEDENCRMSSEECLKLIGSDSVSNYDYAQAVCDLVDNELEAGRPNPLGEDGEQVKAFFEKVIDRCDGDKSRFPAVYQALLGDDDKRISMTRNR